MKFEITAEQHERINQWLETEVYPVEIARQKESGEFDAMPIAHDSWEQGFPYTGAIGGGMTYSFSPTSIGLVTKVTYLDHSLDLTDYENW